MCGGKRVEGAQGAFCATALSLSPSPEVTDKEFSMNTVAAEAESEALNHLNQADTSGALGDG